MGEEQTVRSSQSCWPSSAQTVTKATLLSSASLQEWQLTNLLTMKLILQLLTCAAALVRPILTAPQRLQSELPLQPIEDPDLWAWGQHPNGLGYKAANDLLFETCLTTPNSPLCYN